MTFTEESQIVKGYVLLITSNIMTFDEVPDIYNLREVVWQVLSK